MKNSVGIKIVVAVLGILMWGLNLITNSYEQYFFLSRALWDSKTYFVDNLGKCWDCVEFGGKFFWPLGILPAIMLMPGVGIFGLFGLPFFQGFLQPVLVAGVFYFCMKIAKAYKFEDGDQWVWGLAFCGSSIFLFLAMWVKSWYFAQIVGCFWVMAAITEYSLKRRWGLVGMMMGLAALARMTAGVGVVFFVFEILADKKNVLINLVKLVIPFAVAVMIWGGYNQIRFGRWYDQGYAGQIDEQVAEAKGRALGLFRVFHVPGNLYYMLFRGLDPVFVGDGSHVFKFPYIQFDPWGGSIFITSPWLVYLFLQKYNDKRSKSLWVTILLIILPIVTYFGIGLVQMGYRYSLDFMPWIFLLLVWKMSKNGACGKGFRVMIVGSTLFNLYLLLTRLG